MNMTVNQIAFKTGLSKTHVRRRIKQHAIKSVGKTQIQTRPISGGVINQKSELYDFEQVKAVLNA